MSLPVNTFCIIHNPLAFTLNDGCEYFNLSGTLYDALTPQDVSADEECVAAVWNDSKKIYTAH